MERTLIQKHTSTIIESFLNEAESIGQLNHPGIKGNYREIFVSKILKYFLPNQFEIGSGTIINQKGQQSKETDIIIYDNRILPPFIKEKELGVFPAESVLATIEIKSTLSKDVMLESEGAAQFLINEIYNPQSFASIDYIYIPKPICSLFAFGGSLGLGTDEQDEQKQYLSENIHYITSLCIANKFSWISLVNIGWQYQNADLESKTYEEIKRFIAILLDTVRTISEYRYRFFMGNIQLGHRDSIGLYIRDQDSIKELFKDK